MNNAPSTLLTSKSATQLARARVLTHRAAQHLTALARANIAAKPDDSHSNLGWDANLAGLCTHPIGAITAALNFPTLSLVILNEGQIIDELALAGKSITQVDRWIDEAASSLELVAPSSATIPYDLPADAAALETYETKGALDELQALSEWFGLADTVLGQLKMATSEHRPGPSPVRCWPHHFDIATYISFEEGDPETARGMGVGMSPGDEGHDQPYFYINPWPYLDTETLPEAVAPGFWHVDGYVGMVATGSALQETGFTAGSAADFINYGFKVAYDAQWPS